jgi:hypothetical protein
MSLSDSTQNPKLAVPSGDALRSIPIAAFSGGEIANVNVPASGIIAKYWLDKDSVLVDDNGATVYAARPSIVTFAPLVVDPLIPGRWRIIL